MRALIMILILMDYVKKEASSTQSCRPPPACKACRSHPCENGGTCIPVPNSYTCQCQTGYQGKQCEEETCRSHPCENEGTCIPVPNSYTCQCQTGYQGKQCEEESPTTVANSGFQTDSTPKEATTTFTPPATKSVPVSIIAGSIGGIVLIVLLTIGLVIFFRERKRRHASDDTEIDYTKYSNDIHSNPTYDALCAPSADKVPTFAKDSGFDKHDESVEGNMMEGEYNTLRLHFPVINEPQDNTYNHIGGSLTADSTYSHIPNAKNALFDNTYSHMSNVSHGNSLEPEAKDATYNHLGDSCSSKRKGKTEESRDETYNHAQMNRVRPTADQVDPGDNYSHINLSGLKAQMPNADEHRDDAREPTGKNAKYAKANNVTKIVDKEKKQHGDSGKDSTATAEGESNSEGHTYFVLESNTDQHPKQAPFDYEVVATPEKNHSVFTVVETDTQQEYFVIEPTTELQ
ncbi:delta-like protein D isoform X2 [Mya arenaria]|uniref:delta-like protein D isoform X2 n=1 Tax=Mya arenaria TaxID=6604 RepID=UPI0022E690A6|nr:delta-like protein D isoform X2 [Mya arenaria]